MLNCPFFDLYLLIRLLLIPLEIRRLFDEFDSAGPAFYPIGIFAQLPVSL